MKKSENLVATLLSLYACILLICIFLYWLFKYLQLDIGLSTNLLIWSATIFAPIAVLMTYTNWREQKSSEIIALECKDGIRTLFESNKILSDIKSNLRLKPEIDLKIKLELDISDYHKLHIQIIRNLLFINMIVVEKGLYDLILKYDEDYKSIKMILEWEIKFYVFELKTYFLR